MSQSEDHPRATDRARRNLMKMGGIGFAALLGTVIKPKRAWAPPALCFAPGTRIQTVLGDRPVETVAAGDLLPSVFGGLRPVQWIGRYSYKRTDKSKPWAGDVLPVRIKRSALAANVPHSDLYVTKGHAVLFDGVLIPIGDLINGTTIALCDADDKDQLDYFHIKLESHDVILANGAPCETLLSVDENAVNFAEYFRAHGMPAGNETRCAPFLCYNGGRSQLRSRFRSALSPWVDRRRPFDVIRDRLEERGAVALLD